MPTTSRVPPAALVAALFAGPVAAAEPVDYLKDVRSVLAARCFACHGALQQKAGLRADTAKALRDSGAVVPGKSADSPLIAHVLGAGDAAKMPPPADGEPLTDRQVALLKAWIDAGAAGPPDEKPDPDPREHWAFRAPVRPPVPRAKDRARAANPIDAFLAAGWAKHGLTPQAPADKRLLLRRVTLDLTGLPPTPAEIDAFLADPSLDAYEKRVEALLASPQYGERWGRHFLDVWRYSDWWGLGAELRNSQKHIWHWRDWVVESLNADLGYDEMVRQMLAADELYPTDPAKLRATGYLARPYFRFNRTTWLDEVVEHTAKGFLGLTVNCAKCHDHKYDPVSQQNYYQFRAIFEPYQLRTDMVPGEPDFEKDGIPRAFDCNPDAPTYRHERGDERRPVTDRPVKPGVPALLAFGEFTITPVTLPPEAYSPHLRPWVVENYRRVGEARLLAVRAVAGTAAGPGVPPPKPRGALKTPESNVEPEANRLKPFPTTSTGRRTALAKWVADARNPLTARVLVNHVWARHFGRPLVATVFDLGRKGAAPTHPELLDWLACEFTDRGWSVKHLHRLIVTSAAYRMSSATAGDSAKVDPENRHLWRQNPVRMEAQAVRDALLHLAGDLDLTPGGPPVPVAGQDASRRRSLYFFQSHNDHNRFLSQFDDANVLECYRRSESIVPQQALALSNSRLALRSAEAIAAKLHQRAGDDAGFIPAAFETILGYTPAAAERDACLAALAEWRTQLTAAKHPDPARKARTNLVGVLLNHNDFVTVR